MIAQKTTYKLIEYKILRPDGTWKLLQSPNLKFYNVYQVI